MKYDVYRIDPIEIDGVSLDYTFRCEKEGKYSTINPLEKKRLEELGHTFDTSYLQLVGGGTISISNNKVIQGEISESLKEFLQFVKDNGAESLYPSKNIRMKCRIDSFNKKVQSICLETLS